MEEQRIWVDHTSDLGASVDTVARLLFDIDGWPSWTPGLAAVWRIGKEPIEVGTRFVMVLRPAGPVLAPTPTRILRLDRDRLIEWGGGLLGSEVRHRFELEAAGEGRCRVRHVEHATGWLTRIDTLARIAERHDLRWSAALEARFAA
jgi:hypothetical protein